jgi:hypothetical protein
MSVGMDQHVLLDDIEIKGCARYCMSIHKNRSIVRIAKKRTEIRIWVDLAQSVDILDDKLFTRNHEIAIKEPNKCVLIHDATFDHYTRNTEVTSSEAELVFFSDDVEFGTLDGFKKIHLDNIANLLKNGTLTIDDVKKTLNNVILDKI